MRVDVLEDCTSLFEIVRHDDRLMTLENRYIMHVSMK